MNNEFHFFLLFRIELLPVREDRQKDLHFSEKHEVCYYVVILVSRPLVRVGGILYLCVKTI